MDQPNNISAWSLESLVKDWMKVCEVGVRSGQSSEMFLEKGAFVYMVDPWAEYPGYQDTSDSLTPSMTVYEADYQKTLERIKRFEGRYQIIRETSDNALVDVPDDLDFIYIDGNHETPHVYKDVLNYWRKLKKGGYMAGDDWSMPSVMSGILKAFSEIVAEQNINEFNLIYWGRNWVIKKP